MKRLLLICVLLAGGCMADLKHVMIVWEGSDSIEDYIVLEEKNGMIHLQPAEWNKTTGKTEATTDSPHWCKVSDIKKMTERNAKR